jgi:hypothetical protein
MAILITNPYPEIGKMHQEGLDSIISQIVGQETKLNEYICNFIKEKFSYSSESIIDTMELNSIYTIAQNAYVNNEIIINSLEQASFIHILLNKIKLIPTLEIDQYLANVEIKISESDFSSNEKLPFYLALSIGRVNNSYWLDIIKNPGEWSHYINDNYAVNLANIPYWVSAAMEATLYYCYKGSYITNELQPPQMAGPNIVTALTASLAVGAGKVILGFTKNPFSRAIFPNGEPVPPALERGLPTCSCACSTCVVIGTNANGTLDSTSYSVHNASGLGVAARNAVNATWHWFISLW